LLISGVGQVGSFALYVAAALGAGGVGLLWVATIAEGVLGTMATVALFALMMDASDPEHAGTDYTLLACVVIVVGMIANYCGAAIADAFGYTTAHCLLTQRGFVRRSSDLNPRRADSSPPPAHESAFRGFSSAS
jgi:Na+/melibiose symporter-like transporter